MWLSVDKHLQNARARGHLTLISKGKSRPSILLADPSILLAYLLHTAAQISAGYVLLNAYLFTRTKE